MKDQLREIVKGMAAPAARNAAREYLQAQVLASLQRQGAMVSIAFQGGTALRFLYSIRRYSEDLDFSVERPSEAYDIRAYVSGILSDLGRLGYTVDAARIRDSGAVHSAFVRFPGLMYELSLSGQRTEALAVKLEVDSRPPAGATLETTLVRRYELLNLQHHDRASLLAGKLHAVLTRPYPKGRDYYGLIWYLSDRSWPAPNLELLNNALRQTGWARPALTAGSWRAAIVRQAKTVKWQAVVADVRPLLENPADVAVLDRESLVRLLTPERGTKTRTRRD